MKPLSPSVRCAVCFAETDGRVRFGALVCSACKSFFNRTESATNLKCNATSTAIPTSSSSSISVPDCLEAQFHQRKDLDTTGGGGDMMMMWTSRDGRNFRQICPKCRFNRCLAVKMTKGLRKQTATTTTRTSPITDSKNNSAHFDALNSQKCGESNAVVAIGANHFTFYQVNEEYVANLQSNYELLRSGHAALPGRAKLATSWQELLDFYIENFHQAAPTLSTFCRSLPGFTQTDMADRCTNFQNMTFRLSTLLSAASLDPSPLALNADNFAMLVATFKGNAVLDKPSLLNEQWHIFQVLLDNGISEQDFPFLFTLAFYCRPGGKVMKQPESWEKAMRQAMMLVAQKYGCYGEQKIRSFLKVIGELDQFQIGRQMVRREIVRICQTTGYQPKQSKIFFEMDSTN